MTTVVSCRLNALGQRRGRPCRASAEMDLWWRCACASGKRSRFLAQKVCRNTVFCRDGILSILNRGSIPDYE